MCGSISRGFTSARARGRHLHGPCRAPRHFRTRCLTRHPLRGMARPATSARPPSESGSSTQAEGPKLSLLVMALLSRPNVLYAAGLRGVGTSSLKKHVTFQKGGKAAPRRSRAGCSKPPWHGNLSGEGRTRPEREKGPGAAGVRRVRRASRSPGRLFCRNKPEG